MLRFRASGLTSWHQGLGLGISDVAHLGGTGVAESPASVSTRGD